MRGEKATSHKAMMGRSLWCLRLRRRRKHWECTQRSVRFHHPVSIAFSLTGLLLLRAH
jgi:hypothetical protein